MDSLNSIWGSPKQVVSIVCSIRIMQGFSKTQMSRPSQLIHGRTEQSTLWPGFQIVPMQVPELHDWGSPWSPGEAPAPNPSPFAAVSDAQVLASQRKHKLPGGRDGVLNLSASTSVTRNLIQTPSGYPRRSRENLQPSQRGETLIHLLPPIGSRNHVLWFNGIPSTLLPSSTAGAHLQERGPCVGRNHDQGSWLSYPGSWCKLEDSECVGIVMPLY